MRNPRTGEPLKPWQEVQKLDPDIPPLATYFVHVEVVNEDGPRTVLVKVRAVQGRDQQNAKDCAFMADAGMREAKKLGFVPTGRASWD